MLERISFSFGKYNFEILHRPGIWMDERKLSGLHARLVALASEKLGMVPDFSFFADKSLLGNKLVSICSESATGTDLSCCVMTYLGKYRGRNIIHLGAVYSLRVDRGFMQLVYIFGFLYCCLRNWLFRTIYITSITHTPKIFGAVCDCFDEVFPNLDKAAAPREFHVDVKKIFSETYLKEWSLPAAPEITDRFIIPGFRRRSDGSILYPDSEATVPKHLKKEYNARCMGLIDYSEGDVVLQVGSARGILSVLKNRRIFKKAR